MSHPIEFEFDDATAVAAERVRLEDERELASQTFTVLPVGAFRVDYGQRAVSRQKLQCGCDQAYAAAGDDAGLFVITNFRMCDTHAAAVAKCAQGDDPSRAPRIEAMAVFPSKLCAHCESVRWTQQGTRYALHLHCDRHQLPPSQ